MLTDKIEENTQSWNEVGSVFDKQGEIGDCQGQEIILEYLGYI